MGALTRSASRCALKRYALARFARKRLLDGNVKKKGRNERAEMSGLPPISPWERNRIQRRSGKHPRKGTAGCNHDSWATGLLSGWVRRGLC